MPVSGFFHAVGGLIKGHPTELPPAQDDGALDAIELTAGSSLVNPMYLFHGDAPLKEFAGAFKPPLR